jgi:cytochrome P450
LTLPHRPREDVVLPLSKPVHGHNGSKVTEVLVPKGTIIFLSLLSSNRNPDIWGPDSFEWKPERWMNRLPDSVSEAKIPGVYSHL